MADADAQSDARDQPDVAVVIPTHNRRDYLREAIDSVLDQRFDGRTEIVIVDDGSTDDTAEMIRKYVDQPNASPGTMRVRCIYQPNQGQAVARNTAIAHTTAPLIAFLDDDDICEPTRLATQTDAMRNDPGAGLAHSSFWYIDEHGHKTNPKPQRLKNPNHGSCVDTLLNEMLVIFSTVMVRRDIAQRAAATEPHKLHFDPQWVRAQDYDFVLRIARLSRFVYLPTPQLQYRLHGGNNAMTPTNLKRTYGYHCRVQMDFVRRWGQELGIDDAEAKRRAARFLHGRAEAAFWRRELSTSQQLCALASELNCSDERFERIARKASRPVWMYRFKDAIDHLLGRADAP